MAISVESDRISRSILVWHRYAPDVKADLFSTAILSPAGAFLVDPIRVGANDLLVRVAPATVAGVVITNENHARAASEFAQEFGVPIYAHIDTAAALNLTSTAELCDGREFAPGLTAIAIEGAPAGEVAIYSDRDGGSLIIGDALINMGSYGFTLLPAKYCSNQKRMRKSLCKLLDYELERLVFAHGVPIVSQAKRRLAEVLERDA